MTEARNGRIITFYSYKGGTGRTMALSNVAWILAANGHRVLTVDWDLESPGLHKFFRPFLDSDKIVSTPGVIELITEYAWAASCRCRCGWTTRRRRSWTPGARSPGASSRVSRRA